MAGGAAGRSSAEIQAEIEQQIGFLPPIYASALSHPELFDALWTGERTFYLQNPLPPLFKEKLFALLSRHCRVPYTLICHSCTLHRLGLSAADIFRVLTEHEPADPEPRIRALAALPAPLEPWLASGSPAEHGLLSCATHLFLGTRWAGRCQRELERLLGPAHYNHLVALLGHVRSVHAWVEGHPDLAPSADPIVAQHLGTLLADEPRLGGLLATFSAGTRPGADRRLQDVLDTMAAVLSIKDTSGRFLLVNRQLEMLHGLGRDQLLGRTEHELLPKELADERRSHDLRVLATGRALDFEESLPVGGDRRVYLTLKFPFRDESGAIVAICAIGLDVTARRQQEEQLRQARKMEAVGRLTASIAHDFNNLLTAIQGYGALLLDELEPADPRRSGVEEIQRASARGVALTRQLLAYSRDEAIEREVLDLNEVLAGIEALLGQLLGAGIELRIVPRPRPAYIRINRGQLEQVIVNLAVNARDAMPDGGRLTLEVTASRDEPGIALRVADTGHGIEPAIQERIFEPFFTTKPAGEGTGLGLPTVYTIVTGNDGRIRVDSVPGQGATFRLVFPEATPTSPPSAAAAPATASRGTETVLLVEDEDAVRGLAAKVLRRHGYAVLEARNGLDALRVYEQHGGAIDLVLTDVVMPEMGGGQLVEQLRALQHEPRVLYMSGYADSALVNHGVADLGDAFLQKPFLPTELTAKVRNVLDR